MIVEKLTSDQCPWLESPAIKAIMSAIESAGGEARIVGGAVRDALLGRPIGDIDLACTLPPDQMVKALDRKGIKNIPTGIDHGTITAVYDHKGYEITTLRHDIQPDGRHSKVAFTTDWAADAARRDFTINGLYLDKGGNLHDFFDGRSDLTAGLIRFIGDPAERIQEDYLRILRAFRFMAQLEGFTIEEQGLKACISLSGSLSSLSVERVWKEISKLMAAVNPVPACKLMCGGGVLLTVLPEATMVDRLEALVRLEAKTRRTTFLTRLVALLDYVDPAQLSSRLRLSRNESQVLGNLRGALGWDKIGTIKELRQKLYDYGKEVVQDAVLLREAASAEKLGADWLSEIERWSKPAFPLQGKDLKTLGIPEGPEMGRCLAEIENWWREQDFEPDKKACLEKVEAA